MDKIIRQSLQLATANAKKVELYSHDINFIESVMHIKEADIAFNTLDNYTFIIFKPDAIASDSITKALTFLEVNNLNPVGFKDFTYNRNMICCAWRYQINIATPERLRVVEYLLCEKKSFYVLLKMTKKGSKSASTRLKELKGHAAIELRTKDCLRTALSNHNTFLNKIHTPDDTADFIRELSIYFSYEERLNLLQKIKNAESVKSIEKVASLMTVDAEYHSLEVDDAFQSISKSIECSIMDENIKKLLIVILGNIKEKEKITHEDISTLLIHRACFKYWDLSVILTQYVKANRDGTKKIL